MRNIIRCVSIFIIIIIMGFIAISLTGCTEADKVSQNIAKEADNFNVYRRVVIINTRTDKPEFEVIGKMSIEVNAKRLNIIVEEGGKYYKHIINLTNNNMYIVEDLGGSNVNQFKYEINYIPESIVPFTITNSK